MSTDIDSDQVFSTRGSRADPMAEHKQRARWRMIGATAYCIFVALLALQVLRDKPRHLASEFTVIMPLPNLPMSGRPLPPVPGFDEVDGQPSPEGTPASAAPAPATPEPSAAAAVAPATAATGASAASIQKPLASEPVVKAPAAADAKPAKDLFHVQIGAYSTRAAAETVRKRMESSGHRCFISAVGSGTNLRYRVRVGPMSRDEAEAIRARAKLQGYEAAVVK